MSDESADSRQYRWLVSIQHGFTSQENVTFQSIGRIDGEYKLNLYASDDWHPRIQDTTTGKSHEPVKPDTKNDKEKYTPEENKSFRKKPNVTAERDYVREHFFTEKQPIYGNLAYTDKFLETRRGCRKYVKVKHTKVLPEHLWFLFGRYWKLRPPRLAISVMGDMKENTFSETFTEELRSLCADTSATILTDGKKNFGNEAHSIGNIFGKVLRGLDHKTQENVSLLGFIPWKDIKNQRELSNCNLGSDVAKYSFENEDSLLESSHSGYILVENDGTSCRFCKESGKYQDQHACVCVRYKLETTIVNQNLPNIDFHMITYKITTITSTNSDANFKGNVFVMLQGKKGFTCQISLLKENNSSLFLPGRKDIFYIEIEDVGKLGKLHIGVEGNHIGRGWLLEKVDVLRTHDKDTMEEYLFKCGQWFSTGNENHRFVRVLKRNTRRIVKNSTGMKYELGAKIPVVLMVFGGFTDEAQRSVLKRIEMTCEENHNEIPIIVMKGSGGLADLLVKWIENHDKPGNLPEEKEETEMSKVLAKANLRLIFDMNQPEGQHKLKRIVLDVVQKGRDLIQMMYIAFALNDVSKIECFLRDANETDLQTMLDRNPADSLTLLDHIFLAGNVNILRLFIKAHMSKLTGSFLTIERLRILYSNIYSRTQDDPLVKLLTRFCDCGKKKRCITNKFTCIPHVGNIIHGMMGEHHRRLYQERQYTNGWEDCEIIDKDEATWHLFVWAVLTNNVDLAKFFLETINAKIGAALIACLLFRKMATSAEALLELEMVQQMQENARLFEEMANDVLTTLFGLDSEAAFTSIISALPYMWGMHVTPLSLAEEARAELFMSNLCCQTYLSKVWFNNMNSTQSRSKIRLSILLLLVPILNLAMPSVLGPRPDKSINGIPPILDKVWKQIFEEDKKKTEQKSKADQHRTKTEQKSKEYEKKKETEKSLSERVKNKIEKGKSSSLEKIKLLYSAPIAKFELHLASYLFTLVLFTTFVLRFLRPIQEASDVSPMEMITIVFVAGITIEEIVQMVSRKYSRNHKEENTKEKAAKTKWKIEDFLSRMIYYHKISYWYNDPWHLADTVMALVFYAAVIARFTLPPSHFRIVIFLFSISLILFYIRIFKFTFVHEKLGSAFIQIIILSEDVLHILLFIFVFVMSFGILFQSIIEPYHPPGILLLANILWRPFWALFRIHLEDVTEGQSTSGNFSCTTFTEDANPDVSLCYSMVLPYMFAIYLFITSLVLLTLLPAILIHTSNQAQNSAKQRWMYRRYTFVHNYYEMPPLPPPFNFIIYILDATLGISSKIKHIACAKETNDGQENNSTTHQNNVEDKKTNNRWKHAEKTSAHFWLPSAMRDVNKENKAFKFLKLVK